MTIANEPAPGYECEMSYNSGTNASPTWVPMPMVRNLSEDESITAIDVSIRGSQNKKYFGGQSDVTVNFDYLYRKGASDAVFTFLQGIKDARTPTQFAIADNPIATSGCEYSKDYYVITKFAKKQDLDGVTMFDVEMKPALFYEAGSLIERSYVTVT